MDSVSEERSGEAEEQRQRAIDREHYLVVEAADGFADLLAGDRLRLVNHDLRRLAQAIFCRRLNLDAKKRSFSQGAGDRQYRDGRVGIEQVMGKVTAIPEAVNLNYRPFDKAGVQPTLERHGIHFRYILYVGSVEPRKNLLRLLEAYTQFRSRSPGWHLVIVGARNIWKSSLVAEVVEKQGLQDWFHFTGYIPEKDLPALYNGADLFVFPSLYEGFGLPVLEAMACGTPVVTSKISSLPEVAGDAALLVDPYNSLTISLTLCNGS